MIKSVLIVEDNPRNMKLFRDVLQANGYQTIEATDGKQGVDKAFESLPDLIILDIMLPKMSGLEVATVLKADPLTHSIPILAISSFAMIGDKEKAKNAGCDHYITKPINVREFVKKVSDCLLEVSTKKSETMQNT